MLKQTAPQINQDLYDRSLAIWTRVLFALIAGRLMIAWLIMEQKLIIE